MPLLFACKTKNEDKSVDYDIEGFNYIIGTQTVGAKYKFTEESNLVETAKAIKEMGSNLLKFSMSPRYWWENYDIEKNESITSLRDLAQEPSMKEVLEMDFKYYQIWLYEFSHYTQEPPGEKRDEYQIKFIGGLSDDYAQKSYHEIYELACYLLKTYSGSDKIFMLGNWEADWHLRWDYDKTKTPDPKSVEGMIKWFNVRQKAIDDAKRDTPHSGIEMYHYMEMNLSELAINNEVSVTNSVLPFINPDYVSFSSYSASNPPNTEAEMKQMLTAHLDYINSKIQPKEGIKGKRLFIGEYGWHEQAFTRDQINERSKWVIKTGLEWGCPFILFWEMYNNELDENGKNKGFWLIDDKGEKTPLYHTHQNFYKESKDFLLSYKKEHNRLPSQDEFSKAAVLFNSLK